MFMLSLQLQDVEASLDTHKSFEHKAKESEQNIVVLSQELQRVTEQLNLAEEQASHPPPMLTALQQEIAQLKVKWGRMKCNLQTVLLLWSWPEALKTY